MLDEVAEKLQDALSIISLLENDMEMQKAEMVYIRAVKMIHKLNKEAYTQINAKSVDKEHLV